MLHQSSIGSHHAWRAAAIVLAAALVPASAAAQTDYYNTDAGRPLATEDALAIEHRALEIQMAPFSLARSEGGRYEWGFEPAIALGVLPRTQIEVALPLVFADGPSSRSSGMAGIHVGALHNLNAETSIPALALAADVLIPAGSLAPEEAYPSVAMIATRTLPWLRFHLNGRYTFGDDVAPGEDASAAGEVARWMAGLAVDRAFPLESFLVGAELVARQPIVDDADVEWSTALGIRRQLGPRLAADAGFGYRLTGANGWYVTAGAALALGLPWTPR